jgi:hypothetical protein
MWIQKYFTIWQSFSFTLGNLPILWQRQRKIQYKKMRYVCDAKLFNPLTWFDGHWETKND